MIRALILFVKISIAAALAYWLVTYPGQVSIDWQGWKIDTSVGILLTIILISAILIAQMGRILRAIRQAPSKYSHYRKSSRRDKGYQALTQGMVAVAAGDQNEAAKHARKANMLLDEPALTLLLSAQSAQLSGNDKAAKKYFESMLDNPQAAFLGVRGLLMQAVKNGDEEEALRLAEQAYKLRPQTPWVLQELLERQSDQEDWDQALKTIDQALRLKAIERDKGLSRKAEILLRQAQANEKSGHDILALKQATQALKLEAGLIPALTLSARLLHKEGKSKRAEKIIETAWAKTPDPALAKAYQNVGPKDDLLAQVNRFEKLLKLKPDNMHAHIALAEAALNAQLWGKARTHLMMVEKDGANTHVYQLLARLETAEHDDLEAAHRWLAKATEQKIEL